MKFLSQSFVKYALIMSGLIVVCLFLMEVTGQNQSFEKAPIFSIVTIGAPIVVWFFGLKEKKKQLKGKLTVKQGTAEGARIGAVYGIISAFIFLIYYSFVNPGIVEYVRQAYRMSGATNSMVITVDMLVQFASATIFGTLIGAILSLFLKSKKKS